MDWGVSLHEIMNELSVVREMQWWPSRCVSVSRVRARKLLESHHHTLRCISIIYVYNTPKTIHRIWPHTQTHTNQAACSGEYNHNHHTNLNQLEQDTHKQETISLTTDLRFYFTWLTSNALGCSHQTTSNQFSPLDMCIVAEFEDAMGKGGM